MKGIVFIDDRSAVHVVPRAEVRHVEVVSIGGNNWALKYQLAGTVVVRSIEWKGDSRPETLKGKIEIDDYNHMAADFVLTVLTRGHRDLHLERRSRDNVFFVRSGLVEEDAHVVLCRQFIAQMSLTAQQTAIGPLDETRLQMLYEIHAAAHDLILPEWFPPKETPR